MEQFAAGFQRGSIQHSRWDVGLAHEGSDQGLSLSPARSDECGIARIRAHVLSQNLGTHRNYAPNFTGTTPAGISAATAPYL